MVIAKTHSFLRRKKIAHVIANFIENKSYVNNPTSDINENFLQSMLLQ